MLGLKVSGMRGLMRGGCSAPRGTVNLRRWGMAAAIVFVSLLPGMGDKAAQEAQEGKNQGIFLVARRELTDPFFEKSVVLMLPVKGTPLIVGLIVNRPTKVPLSKLYDDSPALQKRDATAYFGGPVVNTEAGTRSALFRSTAQPKDATLVFGDVYVSFDPDTIAGLVENSKETPTLRVFLGRAQWAPEQLAEEMAGGAWYSVRASADSVFGKWPEAVWRTLLHQAQPQPLVQYERPFVPAGNSRPWL
jgi:putative transcriptional regulator